MREPDAAVDTEPCGSLEWDWGGREEEDFGDDGASLGGCAAEGTSVLLEDVEARGEGWTKVFVLSLIEREIGGGRLLGFACESCRVGGPDVVAMVKFGLACSNG